MIPVHRTDPADPGWQEWRDKALATMRTLVANHRLGEKVELQDQLYKAAMPFLLELFHGKCAYCETMISSNQPGDVEHYRPKGRIRDRDGKVLKVRIGDDEVEHPGYWWLAYEWLNLLPSCIDCNRRRNHGDGDPAGKADFFEVRGTRAVQPKDDLDLEQALLLDPSTKAFDPRQHFEFHEDGTIKPITDEARYSSELLGLNLREKLVAQRAQAYLQAKQALVFLLSQSVTALPTALEASRSQINDMWEGRSPYSAFTREALDSARETVKKNTGLALDFPLP